MKKNPKIKAKRNKTLKRKMNLVNNLQIPFDYFNAYESLWNRKNTIILSRHMKFIISSKDPCSIIIKDIVTYILKRHTIDHALYYNNDDSIISKSVKSEDNHISSYTFDNITNIFHLNLSYPFKRNDNNKAYTITYTYKAKNIIKYGYDKLDNKTTKNYNWFLWRIANFNYSPIDQLIYIEILFPKDMNISQSNIEFNINNLFNTSLHIKMNKLKWKGTLEQNNISIFNIKFPLYFSTCNVIQMNMTNILCGTFGLLFIIAISYYLISIMLFQKY